MLFLLRAFLTVNGILALVVMGIVAGAVPFPASGPEGGGAPTRIYVLSNGFHSDIALPARTAFGVLGLDPATFPVERAQIAYVAIGWGSKTAYTSLLAVSDLTPGIILGAFAFDETVMHAQPLGPLRPGERVFAYDLTEAQLDALTAAIAADFASTDPIAGLTQGFGDLFYPAHGVFTPIHSCNTWTGARLRQIGIGVGLWPITAQSLEFGLRRTAIGDQSQR